MAASPPKLDGSYWGDDGESMRFYPKDSDGLVVPSDAEEATIDFKITGWEKASRRRRRRLTNATTDESAAVTTKQEVTITCSYVDCTNWESISTDETGCAGSLLDDGITTKSAVHICGLTQNDTLAADFEPFYLVRRASRPSTPLSRADP